MTDIEGKIRHQGIDEHPAQARDARAPILRPEEIAILKEVEKRSKIDRILQNKNVYYGKEDQSAVEEKTRPQVGLPKMQEKEAVQEEIQANQHQNQVFAGVKATERYRMGHMQKEIEQARTEHGLELPMKQADQLVLEAGNNPTPGKEQQNITEKMTKEEKEWRDTFYDKNKTFPEKVAKFKEMISEGKVAGKRIKLNERAQIKRGKRFMRGISPQDRQKLRKLRNDPNLIIRKMGRCA